MPALYIVATPIGNLEDITIRALRVLKEADIILCEDTRTTRKLLKKYDISTPTLSYPADTTRAGYSKHANPKIEKVIALLRDNKNLALVSDAGTPAISDPGAALVSRIKEELGDAASIIPVPGPSAVIAALSASGLSASDFLFLGFLPHKKGRETLFREISKSKRTTVFYESPHRIMKTLSSLNEHIPERHIVIARELTKVYEEMVCGTSEELIAYFGENTHKAKGEFVVMVEKAR